jgi:putative endonuclease
MGTISSIENYFVYILRCSDNSYYTGVTNNYEKRFAEHQNGVDPSCYTSSRRPLELAYVAPFHEITDAIAWEKKVKGWSRKKKEALIAREYEKLPDLSVRRTPYKKS